MFFIDDLVLRSLGISMPPGLDMIATIEQIQKLAQKEMYNPEKIKSLIKENRLLYEFGELTREEYERTNAELMYNLKVAEEILR
jgi:hypothetical protein